MDQDIERDANRKRFEHSALKLNIMEALRKTGHVAEEALEAVAEITVKTVFGFYQE
jgi:NADH:ubiquinone oxidoreductase subunit E